MSKFTSALNAAKDRSQLLQSSVAPQLQASAPAAPSTPPRRGRPAGKRSDHHSVQVTAYIHAETHLAAKMALLTQSQRGGPRKDFSDLVQELLARWLAESHPA